MWPRSFGVFLSLMACRWQKGKRARHGNLKVQFKYSYLDSNQQLANWIKYLINKREIMTGTGNPARYPGPMQPWVVKKKPQLLYFLTKVIYTFPNCLFFPWIIVVLRSHAEKSF